MTDDKFKMAQGSYTELGNLFILFVSSLSRAPFRNVNLATNMYQIAICHLSCFGGLSRQS